MSISVQTDIFCDVEGKTCVHWVFGGPTANKVCAREARAYAKSEGWVYRYNDKTNSWQDICPNCLKKK